MLLDVLADLQPRGTVKPSDSIAGNLRLMPGKLFHFVQDILKGDYGNMLFAMAPVHDDDFIAPDFGESLLTTAVTLDFEEIDSDRANIIHPYHRRSFRYPSFCLN